MSHFTPFSAVSGMGFDSTNDDHPASSNGYVLSCFSLHHFVVIHQPRQSPLGHARAIMGLNSPQAAGKWLDVHSPSPIVQ